MRQKKKDILEAAVRLFARQGFHATSIQEIVDEVGMAKGSIYFYFKSKDELLASIFEYYGDQMFQAMAEHPGEEDLPGRDRLRLQLQRQFRFLKQHSEFIQMLIKEPLAGMQQEQLKSFVFRFRSRYLNWLHNHVRTIYGKPAERYWADGVLLFSGIMHQFMEGVLIDRDAVDDARLADFLVRRLDDAMQGMLNAGEPPIITHTGIRRIISFGLGSEEEETDQSLLRQLKAKAAGTEAEAVLGLLEAELDKAVPHRVIVQALLALLEKQAEPDWRELLQRLMERMQTI